jgi:hypothetical protein
MDDVRIYNRVLAPGAVAALASGGGADDTDSTVPVVSVAATVATTALKNTPPGVFTVTRCGNRIGASYNSFSTPSTFARNTGSAESERRL